MSSKIDYQELQSSSESRKKVDFQQMERDSLRSESKCDLRKSLAWDSAFFTSPGVLDPEELLETLDVEQNSSKSGSSELERKIGAIGECSLRKSLAWDSAFFTSSGVLNAEELSIVNRGFKNSEMLLLPGAEEEIWKSNGSSTTVNSDTYSLASLEIDLFGGLRASMRGPCESSSNRVISTCHLRRERGMQRGRTMEVLDGSSQSRFAASGEEAKRPPNKRASSSASPLRAPKPASRKNKTCLHNSLSVIPGLTTSAGSPSSVLPTKSKRFGCVISDPADRSPLNPQRMTIHSEPAPPIPVLRTPKYSAGQKRGPVNSSDSAGLWSTSKLKLSSCASPPSSGGGWSSGSSLTPSKQELNNSATHIEIAPCIGTSFDSDASRASDSESQCHDQCLVECEGLETRFKNLQLKKSLKRTKPVLTNVSWNTTPSGLRMPSPKIGFFDEENFTRNGRAQCTFSRVGGVGNTNGVSKRTRYGDKHRLVETPSWTANRLSIKNEQQNSLRQRQHVNKKQDTKKHGLEKFERAFEDNKENMDRLEHQVDVLGKRIGSIGFGRDLVKESK